MSGFLSSKPNGRVKALEDPIVDTSMDLINQKDPDTDVIVITGHASLEFAIGALKRGAYDYVRKPFHTRELVARIRAKLRRATPALIVLNA